MKIITWNVNGIRAALGKNALDWAFARQPDCLMFAGSVKDWDGFTTKI